MLKLIIEDDEGRKTVVPFVREEITIGRQEGNTIRLTERNVSRRHARLLRQNGTVLVEDLGSYNGIRINGERITGQVPVRDGDLIQIGDYDLAIQSQPAQAAPPPTPAEADSDPRAQAVPPPVRNDVVTSPLHPVVPTAPPPLHPPSSNGTPTFAHAQSGNGALAAAAAPAPLTPEPEPLTAPAPAVASADTARRQSTGVIKLSQLDGGRPRQVVEIDAADAPRLVVVSTELAGREFACICTELRIGRADDNDIALDHRSLSRTHAKIVREDDGEWRVLDMQSANGVKVNGEVYAQASLQPGDVLELGHVKLRFVGPKESFQYDPKDWSEKPRRRRGPLVAVAALLVAVAAGGAYYLLGSKPAPRPAPQPPAPVAAPAPVPEPAPPEPTIEPDPVVLAEEKIAEARIAIESRTWDTAAELLAAAKLPDGALHTDAKKLLAEMKGEAEQKRSLDRAEKLLEAGKLEEAGAALNGAQQTKLLRKPYVELRRRWKEAMDARGPKVVAAPKPKPAPPPLENVQKLYEDGLLLFKNKQFREARTQLERCVKVNPGFAPCHKALGGANARLGENEKGAFHYRRFLELAPNDKDAPKVQKILDEYEQLAR